MPRELCRAETDVITVSQTRPTTTTTTTTAPPAWPGTRQPYTPVSELRQRLLLLLRDSPGPLSLREILQELLPYGYTEQAIKKALSYMVQMGALRRVARGYYELSTDYAIRMQSFLDTIDRPQTINYSSNLLEKSHKVSKSDTLSPSVTNFSNSIVYEKLREILKKKYGNSIDEIDAVIALSLWVYREERGAWYLQDAEGLGLDQALRDWLRTLSGSSSISSILELKELVRRAAGLPLYELEKRLRRLMREGIVYCYCRARKIRLSRHVAEALEKMLNSIKTGVRVV